MATAISLPAKERSSASKPAPGQSNRTILFIVLALTVLAVPPRFVNLGELSFYADEETSAFPARAMAEGRGAVMPSGMEYRRALPLTWITALSARIFGPDRDISYRIPVAIFGTLMVPLLFLLGRIFVGTSPAVIAAIMLAFSEWHLVFSRQARMYVPFLFFFFAASYAIWRWAGTGRRRDCVLAIVLFVATFSLHGLGVLAVLFAVISIAFVDRRRVSAAGLLSFAVLGVLGARSYYTLFVTAPYRAWPAMPETGTATASTSFIKLPDLLLTLPAWGAAVAVIGGGLGVWAAVRCRPENDAQPAGVRNGIVYGTAGITGVLAGLGQLYGAALGAVCFLLVHPSDRRTLMKAVALPCAILIAIALGWSVGAVLEFGPTEGVKRLLAFPFPYPIYLARQSLGLILLFGGFCVWLVLRASRQEGAGLRACALGFLLPVAAIGVLSRGGGARFLFPVYPFLLLGAAHTLVLFLWTLMTRLKRKSAPVAMSMAVLVVITGALGGIGLPQSLNLITLNHGEPANQFTHMYPFRPDHEAPGEYVQGMRAPGDVVIAEDPLQQRWYAGEIDYWLRSYADARQFLYMGADGRPHDMYVSSVLVYQEAMLDSIVEHTVGRVWLITSGETRASSSSYHYLNAEQRSWLRSIQMNRTPVFVGRDGVTEVFCLNCPADRRE